VPLRRAVLCPQVDAARLTPKQWDQLSPQSRSATNKHEQRTLLRTSLDDLDTIEAALAAGSSFDPSQVQWGTYGDGNAVVDVTMTFARLVKRSHTRGQPLDAAWNSAQAHACGTSTYNAAFADDCAAYVEAYIKAKRATNGKSDITDLPLPAPTDKSSVFQESLEHFDEAQPYSFSDPRNAHFIVSVQTFINFSIESLSDKNVHHHISN
jgi:hypothetical protein